MGRVTATVLFTDLVGSTDLRGRLGEEAAEELRRTHDRLLVQAVESSGGRVVKGLGDGIMATFTGASDAVAAAVAIQQAVDRLNRSGKAPVPLAVRVGLSAGDLTFEENDVHGTPVIEASRLCGAAEGDEILVSEVVRLLAGLADSDVVNRGRLELKGLHKPVSGWEISWEPAGVLTLPMPALLTDVGRVFVGRAAELSRLEQLWKEAAAGERRVALLAGEPGVGKTRLAAELAVRVHAEGGVVLAGRCDEDLGVPYQPFVEALRHFVDHSPPADLKARLGRYGGELGRLAPELAELIPDLPSPMQSDPETERYRLFDAVAAWLTAASVDEPLVLVLDDLQWAAKPTLLLLRHVVHVFQPRRVLVIATYRDTELRHDHPLVEILADLRRHEGVVRLSLIGLDSSGVAAFMERAAGQALGDEDLALARAIHEETEGNPFFVREVLRHLAEIGALRQHDGRWATRLPVEKLGIPEGVREVVGRRLARLAEDTNAVLRVAAVAGLEIDLAVLQAAGSFEEEVLLSALEEALAARLVSGTGIAGRYRFAHALVRDTLYEGLSDLRRIAYHRHVAEAIEEVYAARLDDHLPALAHHWARASAPVDDTCAVDYAARAGHRALAQLAHDEAVAYYRQALELLEASDPDRKDSRHLDLLISLGEAQRRAGERLYRDTLLEASQLAGHRGDANALARAALGNYRGFFSGAWTVDEARVRVLRRALEGIPSGDSHLRARLLVHLASEVIYAPGGEAAGGVAATREALAMARRLRDPVTLAYVLTVSSHTLLAPLFLEERLAHNEELAALAGHLGDHASEAWGWFWGAVTAMQAGDRERSDRQLDLFDRLASELGQPALRWAGDFARAGRLLLAGQLDEAERLARKAFEVGHTSGQPDARLYYGSQRFWLRFEQGRLDDLAGRLEEVASSTSPPETRALLALLYSELDRTEEINPILAALVPDLDQWSLTPGWLITVTNLASACSRLGDEASAARLHCLLTPYAGQVAGTGPVWVGSVSHYLGVLATTLGHFQEAAARFTAAQSTHERVGAPTWLARTRLEWARMLLARRGPGDADQGRGLLGQALMTARELGLAKVERDTVVLLQECR